MTNLMPDQRHIDIRIQWHRNDGLHVQFVARDAHGNTCSGGLLVPVNDTRDRDETDMAALVEHVVSSCVRENSGVMFDALAGSRLRKNEREDA